MKNFASSKIEEPFIETNWYHWFFHTYSHMEVRQAPCRPFSNQWDKNMQINCLCNHPLSSHPRREQRAVLDTREGYPLTVMQLI